MISPLHISLQFRLNIPVSAQSSLSAFAVQNSYSWESIRGFSLRLLGLLLSKIRVHPLATPARNPWLNRCVFAVRLSRRFRPIFMQQKPVQIISNFAPDTAFEIAATTETDNRRFQLAELLVLPLEEQPIRISLNPLDCRGIL